MPNVYRKAGSGSLEYFAVVGSGAGAREVALGTANLRTALRVYGELAGAAPATAGAVIRTAPGGAADGPSTAIKPRTVHHALAYFLHRGSPDLAVATRRMYRQKAVQLVLLIGDVPLAELSRGQMDSYVAKRQGKGVALETVRKELGVLRQALNLARDLGEFERDVDRVLPRIRVKYKPQRRWLPTAEAEALLAALPPERRLWVLVILYTSARISEARSLLWEEVKFDSGFVHLNGTKTDGSDRFVPLHDVLRAVLVQNRQNSGLVLKPWANPNRDLKAACLRAGIEPASFNALRRTYASWLKQAGVESFAVAKLLGHTTTKMVELNYGHLSTDVYVRAVERLPVIASPSGPPPGRKQKPRPATCRRKPAPRALTCESCGKPFESASNRQRFCGPKCTRAAARARTKG